MKIKILASAMALTLCSSAFAAQVPENVTLANEQTLIWGVAGEVPTLDPTKSSDTASNKIISDLFEGLMIRNPEGEVVPGLAKDWEISDDGLKYTFHLRDAKWSDGEPITADDVIFTLRRVVDPVTGAPYAWYLGTAKPPIFRTQKRSLTAKSQQSNSELKPLTITRLSLPWNVVRLTSPIC